MTEIVQLIPQNQNVIMMTEADAYYQSVRDDVASEIFVRLLTSSVMLTPQNIEALSENSISYAQIFVDKLKN